MKNILLYKEFEYNSAAGSTHKCLQIIVTGCECVCVHMHACKGARGPWRTCADGEMCVCGMSAGKKYTAVLPELYVNQHTTERHSLHLFLPQHVNVGEEVTGESKIHLGDSVSS